MVHNPGYDFNDDNIAIGAAYWVRLVERFLSAERFAPDSPADRLRHGKVSAGR